jgi:hypothetical protein
MMYLTTQSSNQLHTVFGGGYVPEQHRDDTRGYLPASDGREFIVDLAEVLKTLRGALSLR